MSEHKELVKDFITKLVDPNTSNEEAEAAFSEYATKVSADITAKMFEPTPETSDGD